MTPARTSGPRSPCLRPSGATWLQLARRIVPRRRLAAAAQDAVEHGLGVASRQPAARLACPQLITVDQDADGPLARPAPERVLQRDQRLTLCGGCVSADFGISSAEDRIASVLAMRCDARLAI